MINNIDIYLRANKANFDAAMDSVEKTCKNIASKMEKVANVAKWMLVGVTGALSVSVYQAAQEEEGIARLGAALRMAGEDVNFWSKTLEQQIAVMRTSTTISDGMARTVMATGLSMGLSASQLAEATQAALGLSTALGGRMGVEEALKFVIKADEEQYATLGRLVPSILSCKTADEKRAVVANLVAQGIEQERVRAESAAGMFIRLRNVVEDLSEDFGRVFLPLVEALTKRLHAVVPAISDFVQNNQSLTLALTGTAVAILGLTYALPKLCTAIAATANVVKTTLIPAFTWLAAHPVVAAIVAIAAALVWAGHKTWAWHASIKAANSAASDYTETLKKLHEAIIAQREAQTGDEYKAAIKERISLEQKAAEEAAAQAKKYRELEDDRYSGSIESAEALAEKHQSNASALASELGEIEEQTAAISAEQEKLNEAARKEYEAAVLAAEQAGKEAMEKERLALAAKGYTQEQIDAIVAQKELAVIREQEAQALEEARKKEEELQAAIESKLTAAGRELDKLRGWKDESLELFDLVNLGATVEQTEKLARILGEKITREQAEAEKKLLEDAAERLEREESITAEKEAQAAAATAGRFEDLEGMWKRVQSAAVTAPLEREAAVAERQREIKEVNEKIAELHKEGNTKLEQIKELLGRLGMGGVAKAVFG